MENQVKTAVANRTKEWPILCEANSVKAALTHNSPSIQELEKIDSVRLKKEISFECFKFLKINSTGEAKDLTSVQFADDLIKTRPDWKLPEIKIFFETIRQRQDLEGFKVMGNYISPLKLSEMMSQYEMIRSEEREKFYSEKYKEGRGIHYPVNPDAIPKISELIKKLEPKKKQIINHLEQSVKDKEFQIVIAQTDHQGMNKKIQKWMKEFDEIYEEYGITNEGRRYIPYKDETMNEIEFLEHKLNQTEEK